jgi:hypothetical protein
MRPLIHLLERVATFRATKIGFLDGYTSEGEPARAIARDLGVSPALLGKRAKAPAPTTRQLWDAAQHSGPEFQTGTPG